MTSSANDSPRVIVITGASGALGRAVVARLAPGARLVLIDRREVAAPRDTGAVDLWPVTADVTDSASVQAAAASVVARGVRVDALVHVAGGFEMGEPVHAMSRAVWDRMMDLNAWSFANVAAAFVPMLKAAPRGGRVVAVSAAAALRGEAAKGAYAASKAALQRLVESLADELQTDGITVNSVAPTTLDTPANRQAMPGADTSAWTSLADAAEAVAWLASDASRAVTGRHVVLG